VIRGIVSASFSTALPKGLAMCQKGVNPDQMRIMIGQANDSLALAQQWLEQIHHLADHGGLAKPSTEIAQASVLLGEARAKLELAADYVAGEVGGPDASVELV
jgi:hypothetical protein